jgi:RNA polymerase sigma-70 factor, ECF subfamily
MDKVDGNGEPSPGPLPGTLGAVLYPGGAKQLVREEEWAALVLSTAAGDQSALHGLYERARRPVFTLAVRITGNRETAEEVTLDVFLDVWRRAGSYDPANGTVLGWIMNQARSRAIDRVRYETRAKRVDPRAGDPEEDDCAVDPRELLEIKQQGSTVRAALDALTTDERSAIESAFFAGRTHGEVAKQLNQPLGTVKTRIRSALRKLRQAITRQEAP